MSEIKRYNTWRFIEREMVPAIRKQDVDGDYVLYSDYAQKEAECVGLRERVRILTEEMFHCHNNNNIIRAELEDRDKENKTLLENVREATEAPRPGRCDDMYDDGWDDAMESINAALAGKEK